MKKIKNKINVLFLGEVLDEFKKLGLMIFEENLQEKVRIVHIPRIIDIGEKEIYEKELMRYNKKLPIRSFNRSVKIINLILSY